MDDSDRRTIIQQIQPHCDTFHDRLKDAKIQQRKTNQDIATSTGIPLTYVTKFFGGRRADISVGYVAAICIDLGLSMDDLIGIPPQEPEDDQPGEGERLRTELRHKDELLAKTEQQVRMLESGIHARRPLIYSLVGLCSLLAAMLMMYIVLDAMDPDQGMIRANGVSPAIYAGAIALVCIALFAAHTIAKKKERKRQENDRE